MILTDNKTKVDLLNNEAIATTIIGLLGAKPESSGNDRCARRLGGGQIQRP